MEWTQLYRSASLLIVLNYLGVEIQHKNEDSEVIQFYCARVQPDLFDVQKLLTS